MKFALRIVSFCACLILIAKSSNVTQAADLYATSSSANSVYSVTQAGVVTTIVNSGLSDPRGLVFDPYGNYYIANNSANYIAKVTPTNNVSTFSTLTTGSDPIDVILDSQGNLYSSNNNNNTIYKYAPNGTFTTFASGLSGPRGMAIDAQDNIYVVNSTINTISKITPGQSVSTVVNSGLANPVALAFDASGNLFVANSASSSLGVTTNKIVKVDTLGNVTDLITTGLNQPTSLTFDAQGLLYVANRGTGSILKFDALGNSLGTFASGITNIRGIAFVPEPSTYLLGTIVALAIGLTCRNRRSK